MWRFTFGKILDVSRGSRGKLLSLIIRTGDRPRWFLQSDDIGIYFRDGLSTKDLRVGRIVQVRKQVFYYPDIFVGKTFIGRGRRRVNAS